MNIPLHGKHGDGKLLVIDDDDAPLITGRAWIVSTNGYVISTFGRTTTYLHRFLMGVKERRTLVDHRDLDRLNCQRSNLRVCTKSQNNANTGPRKHNKCGVKGVRWHEHVGKWQARITKDRKQVALGYFDSITDAAAAYQRAAERLHGEFARTERFIQDV